jgi:hypothetical protein
MSVKGKTRNTDFTRHVGLFEVRGVVALNPTLEEKASIYGSEVGEEATELEYISDDKEGYQRARFDFYFGTYPNVGIKRHSILMTNKQRRSVKKLGDDEIVKYQFINQLGQTTWSDDEGNLPDWFTNFTKKDKKTNSRDILGPKKVRIAIEGEELLMNFLRGLYNLADNDPSAEISYDYKEFFKGNFKELKEDVLTNVKNSPFTALLTVETSDDRLKQYEKVYGKMFLPSGILKNVNNGAKFGDDWTKKLWEKFEDEVTGEYGPRGYFTLDEVHEYDKTLDPAASDVSDESITPANAKY